MSIRDNYTDEEWRTLTFTPLWVFSSVAGACGNIEPREWQVFVDGVRDAPFYKEPLAREVMVALAGDFQTIQDAFGKDPRGVLIGFRDVADILKRKASSGSAHNFKRTMFGLGMQIANAYKERIFGSSISKEEEVALINMGTLLELDAKRPFDLPEGSKA